MFDPLYLTDAERPLRPTDVQDGYRFYLQFKLRNTWYTRWFRSPGQRSAYANNVPGLLVMSTGEAPSTSDNAKHYRLLEEVNKRDATYTRRS